MFFSRTAPARRYGQEAVLALPWNFASITTFCFSQKKQKSLPQNTFMCSKYTSVRLRPGHCPRPRCGRLQCSSTPLSRFKGVASRGKGRAIGRGAEKREWRDGSESKRWKGGDEEVKERVFPPLARIPAGAHASHHSAVNIFYHNTVLPAHDLLLHSGCTTSTAASDVIRGWKCSKLIRVINFCVRHKFDVRRSQHSRVTTLGKMT